MILVLSRPEGPTILFIQRTQEVSKHKGEIAFPGGGLEESESFIDAALRETQEEIGILADSVEVCGAMDDVFSVTSYVVTPVVGLLQSPPSDFQKQEFEIHRIFEVPLDHLLEPTNFRVERWPWGRAPKGTPIDVLKKTRMPHLGWDPTDSDYPMFFFDTPGGEVWGLSAIFLRQFLTEVFGFKGQDS